MDYFSIIADELTEQILAIKWTETVPSMNFSLILYIVPELLVKLLQQLF